MRIADARRVPPSTSIDAERSVIFRITRRDLVEAGAVGFVGGGVAGIVNVAGGGFAAWLNDCPHWGLPLDANTPELLTRDRERLMCSVHGATFTLGEGVCDGGPCAGSRLQPLEFDVDSDEVRVYAPRALSLTSRTPRLAR